MTKEKIVLVIRGIYNGSLFRRTGANAADVNEFGELVGGLREGFEAGWESVGGIAHDRLTATVAHYTDVTLTNADGTAIGTFIDAESFGVLFGTTEERDDFVSALGTEAGIGLGPGQATNTELFETTTGWMSVVINQPIC